MVNLKDFCQAAGLLYKANADLGTVDVVLAEGSEKSGGKWSMAGNGVPVILNKETPGELMDVDSYIVPGKINIFLWYQTRESDAGYRKCFSLVDVMAKYPDVALYKVNVGNRQSPLATKYPGMVPRMVVVRRGVWNGHSILSALSDPDKFIEEFGSHR